ncbi:amidohydrolase family protein [Dyella halodurans]|uniref:Amidohydrolase family protein n=1 Tax=Dyella halodurans TaxID=1920171 RepID=A0ABV9BZV5_9GAMM|nr:amidohydrolase family protein [Dyella halodurans]
MLVIDKQVCAFPHRFVDLLMNLRLPLLALAIAAPVCATATTTQRLTIVNNGETVGSVVATVDGSHTGVDYAVSNNGRGPKHHEDVILNEHDLPISWTVQGTSLMGGDVAEAFHWSDGHATWISQAEQGESDGASPLLYVLNDTSPWAYGVYARALLRAPNQTLKTTPSGVMHLEKLQTVDLDPAGCKLRLDVYAIGGIDTKPLYVLLDRQGQLEASVDSQGTAIKAGCEAAARPIDELVANLEDLRLRHLREKLAHTYDKPVRISNVHVFDPGTGNVGPLQTVITFNHRITFVGDAPDKQGPADDEVVYDGEGGVLVPGLHDMHSHTTSDSGLNYIAAGVTSTRDMGNVNSFLLKLIPRIDSGELVGPRITPNGFMEGRSPYSARNGFIPATVEEAVKDVDWYADRGYFQIKIYNSMNPDWVAPIAAEAHHRGMRVTGHIPAFDSPDRAIRDGYDEITHINQLALGWVLKPGEDTRTTLRLTALARLADLDLDAPQVRATIELMMSRHIAHDPTMSIVERLLVSRAAQTPEPEAPVIDHMPITYSRYRKRTFVPSPTPELTAQYSAAVKKCLDIIKVLYDRGIRLLPGTDDTNGFSLHRELELYVKAGIPPAQVLRLATLGPEEYMGKSHQLGSIERGKLADFFLIAEDPTKDISAIRSPRLVMKGGVVFFPSEIYEAIGVRPFTTSPPQITRGAKEVAH